VKKRLSDPSLGSHYSPSQIVSIKENLRDDVLTIGFARRFATYKRATLLFSDLDRLDAIVNDPKMPVQFIFAGKAHPADKAGQDLIRRIVEISKEPVRRNPRAKGKVVPARGRLKEAGREIRRTRTGSGYEGLPAGKPAIQGKAPSLTVAGW